MRTSDSRDSSEARVRVTLVGGPTVLIEVGGLRLLTDPTFDQPGPHPVGDRVLTKTAEPALTSDEVGAVDAVLLSHDQHPDNLDDLGREFLKRVPHVITTAAAAGRLAAHTVAFTPWHHVTLPRSSGDPLTVYGVPAVHGPTGTAEASGPVIGFVVAGDGIPSIYVSGDNASLGAVEEIAENLGPIDVAILFAGRARTALLDAYLTLSAKKAARAAQLLDVPVVVPAHFEGWTHFTEGRAELAAAFAEAGLSERLRLLDPGESTEL